MLFKKCAAILSLLCILSAAHATTHPTLVLVHGALFTGRVWGPVQTYLQNHGYPTISIDTPGRLNDGVAAQDASLSAAVEKLCHTINQQPEPVILVGHNQAGAIITQAIASCGTQIKSLVYLAAVVPWPGERPFDRLSDRDNMHFDLSAPLDTTTGLSNPGEPLTIRALFMQDVPSRQAEEAIHHMVPEPIIFAYNTLQYDLKQLRDIPKYYIKTTYDLIIEPASQDQFIARLPMQQVITLRSSHCPFLSQPIELAQTLIHITDAVIAH